AQSPRPRRRSRSAPHPKHQQKSPANRQRRKRFRKKKRKRKLQKKQVPTFRPQDPKNQKSAVRGQWSVNQRLPVRSRSNRLRREHPGPGKPHLRLAPSARLNIRLTPLPKNRKLNRPGALTARSPNKPKSQRRSRKPPPLNHPKPRHN